MKYGLAYWVLAAVSSYSVPAPAEVLPVAPPYIMAQTTSITTGVGMEIMFFVTVEGDPPIFYEWYKVGVEKPVASTSEYIIASVQVSHAGTYRCRVRNAGGEVYSQDAPLTVVVQPAIVTDPASQTVALGGLVMFTVVASGDEPLAYAWYKDGILEPVITCPCPSYMISNAQPSDAGEYYCTVSNAGGSAQSARAILNIGWPPTIVQHPESIEVTAGETATFQVVAEGTPPLHYEWIKDGEPLEWLDSPTYSITPVIMEDEGEYSCQVWNDFGDIQSYPAMLSVVVPPAIITDPASQSVVVGGSVMFTVEASGDEPLAYAWYKDWILEPVITCPCPSYMISNAQPSDAGEYYCTVSNAGGSAQSGRAQLTVWLPPMIVQHPASIEVTAGETATFVVVAKGTSPLNYEWIKNGDPLDTADSHSPTYSISPVTMADAGEYACRVWNDFGDIQSYPAMLTVSGVPRAAFSYEPQNGQAPLTVWFTDLSEPGSSAIQTWDWDFGDGASSTEKNSNHTYTEPGIFTVRLTVRNLEFPGKPDTASAPRGVRVYAGASADVDGDGLTDSDEVNVYGTEPTNPDSDADGMDDGWEVAYGFDPNSAEDAGEDADNDGLTNFEEYRLRSDPLDSASPTRVYYVSPQGDDMYGDGSAGARWRTINHAVSVAADMAAPAVIRLAPGIYDEDPMLPPWTALAGEAGAGDVIISGYVMGSANSGIKNVTIRESLAGGPYPLLAINGPMEVLGVRFEGGAGSTADGIVVNGGGPRGSLIERCEFSGLYNGIIINEAIPLIRRCWFHDLSGSAIIVRAMQVPNKEDDGTLSTEHDPNSGYNTIDLASIDGDLAVVNQRDEPLIMENNDWGTDIDAEIGSRVSGASDYVPYLAKGSGAGAATANCNVWDSATLEPVTSATVQLSKAGGSFSPLTENAGGVYTFACLAPGPYTFSVTAPSFNMKLQTKTLAAGDNVMLLFPLTSSGNEGEGEGEKPDGCFGGVADRFEGTPRAGFGIYAGDFAILMAVAAALAAARKKRSSNLA
ncbi:MAG: immunoglobulin domain-containing protein [Candidatus Hydrogenedentes bacterium]|nr:immunoglobulin domain-containing protein [Candidatus Hydrogenedentota bacterium]